MSEHVNSSDCSSLSTRALLQGIWSHLSRLRRWQLLAALLLMLASGVAEVGSLAIAAPFLAVLSDPQRLWQQQWVRTVAVSFGVTSPQELLLPVTLAFGVAAVLAAAVRLLNLWMNGKLAAAIGSDLSCEAYKRTLHQPYIVHVQRNSSGVITAITTQIAQTVLVLNYTLQMATAAVVSVGILGALLAIDWAVACTAILVFCTAYGLFTLAVRRRLAFNSRLVASSTQKQLKSLQEGLGSIRDVLLDGNQNIFLDIYEQSDRPMRQRIAQNRFLGTFPRYGLEAIGLVLIALLGLLLSWQRAGSASVIPILGTLALGSQRLLPALQQIYGSWASIRSVGSGVEKVLEKLNQPLPSQYLLPTSSPLCLGQTLQFEGVCFRYGEKTPLVLDGIDLEINKGERVGFIGSTGSGKSTLVDLLMGLLAPTNGRILIDGADLNDPYNQGKLLSWRSAIAHVPQNIFLTDGSIAENIAFGIPRHQIDHCRVQYAARQAQIASFIESSPEGYNTFVGERGVRLSGGQRQRIGIARALYKKASFIVLDEATSALDMATEGEVMNSLDGLDRELTVVMIAHRQSTLSRCDRIVCLRQGSIKSEGPPQLMLTQL